MARQQNGSIRIAAINYQIARSSVRLAEGSFLPTLSPSFRYDVNRQNFQTGLPGTRRDTTSATLDVDLRWQLLDSGERGWTLLGNRRDAEAAEAGALGTLRSVLFTVHQQYFDALRNQELLRVQDLQLTRSETILDQTKTRVELGDAPRKDILQAQADFLNAKATALASRNRVVTSQANLKATIGWDREEDLPVLVPLPEPALPPIDLTLEDAIAMGLENRPDLRAQRKRVESAKVDLRLAKIAAGVTWTLDGAASKSFAPDVNDSIGLVFRASLPVLDGNRSREAVRTRQLGVDSAEVRLLQDERNARSEIESAYKEYILNRETLSAAKAALEAARENYAAAQEAQKLGAGDLIAVLTAQVSLVTAESNYVQAVYDLLISDVQLRLVTGRPVPGEEL